MNMKLAQLFTKNPDLENKFNLSKMIQEGIEKFIIENSKRLEEQQISTNISLMFGIAKFKDDEAENKLKERAESIKTKDINKYEDLRTYLAWDIYRRVTKIHNEVNKQDLTVSYDELEEVNKEEEKFNKQTKVIQPEQPILSQYHISIDDKLLMESLEVINKTYPDYMYHLKMMVNEEICKTIDKIKNEPLEMSIPYNNSELYKDCPVKPQIKIKDLSDYDKKRLLEISDVTEDTDINNAIFCPACKINLIEGGNLCLTCAKLK